MRATLIYNESSGTDTSEDEIVAGLREIGWTVDACHGKQDLDACIATPADVIVAAGGDGTIAKVARRLAGTSRVMAIVPTGTANNIARSLGIGVDPAIAVRGLAHATERRVDLGLVMGRPEREDEVFFEGFGMGVFAYVIGEKATKKDKKLRRALELIAEELEAYEPRHIDIDVDGKDLSGNYVLAAVMNARSFGPSLELAPDAKCDDGELDVVLVPAEAKEALLAHLRRAAVEGNVVLPQFETHRARRVAIRADGRWAHVDDDACELEGKVTIDVLPGALRALVPSPAPLREPRNVA